MAFEQLTTEGFIEGRVGVGTYVNANLAVQIKQTPTTERRRTKRRQPEIILSRRGAKIAANRAAFKSQSPTAFLPNQPAYDMFPFATWSRLTARRVRQPSIDMLNYGDASGYPPLRRAIANYLRDARGIKCDESQVIVVSGTQMAMSLTAWILLNPGDSVLMEDPFFLTLHEMLAGFGARIINVPVDKNGMDVSAGIARKPDARLTIISPSHQYPLGVTLSLPRRLELLAWATKNNSWIVEDDYDSEFRFSSAPLAPLQTLDRNDRVIYAGTMSKVIFPSLRIGYLVLPPGLVDAYSAAVHLMTRGVSTLTQAVLTDFIENGHFSNHIRRMRLIYAERHSALRQALHEELDGYLNVSPTRAGMNVIGWLPPGKDDRDAKQAIQDQGVMSFPISYYYTEQTPRSGLFLGFCCTPPEKMLSSVQKMAKALDV
jgi:GntR family transcriptional regulator/MocR family aminotransferase